MSLKHCPVLLLVCFMLSSCASPRSGVYTIDDSPKAEGLNVIDIGMIAERMAGALLDTPEIENASEVTKIALLPVINSTPFNINQGILLEEIRIQLNKHGSGKILILERDWSKESFKDRNVLGGDFYLESELVPIPKGYLSSRSDYNRIFFRLIDPKTDDIIWENHYAVKRVGMPGVTYPRNKYYKLY